MVCTLKGIAGATAFILLLAGCRTESDRYRTFADFPGFASYYAGRCADLDPGPPTISGLSESPSTSGGERWTFPGS